MCRLFRVRIPAWWVLGILAVPASAQDPGSVITFETLPGGSGTTDDQPISTQYAGLPFGVRFELLNGTESFDPPRFPRIAKAGLPLTAFQGCDGTNLVADTLVPSEFWPPQATVPFGDSFLTGFESGTPTMNMLVSYTMPVRSAHGWLMDIEFHNSQHTLFEEWTIEALDESKTTVIDSMVLSAQAGPNPCGTQSGSGEGAPRLWQLSSPSGQDEIWHVRFRYTGSPSILDVGFAFDNFCTDSSEEAAAIAHFTATPRVGEPGLEVSFFDQSSEHSSGHTWDFGDGNTSTDENPTHTYTNAGDYTVKLTVTDDCGTHTFEREEYVSVHPAGTRYAHFSKQTQAAGPAARYTLPAVEADNDGFGIGAPSSDPGATCDNNSDRTNPDIVRVVITNLGDETPLRALPPGDELLLQVDYRVVFNLPGTTTAYGCEYELYEFPDGESPVRIVPSGNQFHIDVPVGADEDSLKRAIQARFFTDPDRTNDGLRSVILEIDSISVLGSPQNPPVLEVGANDRAVWLLEDNVNPVPALPGDDCSDALTIVGEGKFPFTTNGHSTDQTACGLGGDVWFKWTAPEADCYCFDTFDAQFDTVVEIYTGTCAGGLTSVDCDNGSTNVPKRAGSAVQLDAAAQTEYHVRVGAAHAAMDGLDNLTIQKLIAGDGPYVQFTHTTPATRRAEGQVSTKVVRDFHNDYFGIRFKDANRESEGEVSGVGLNLADGITIEVTVTAPPEADFMLYGAFPPNSPVNWTIPDSVFTVDVLSGSDGLGIWSAFGDSTAGGFSHDVALEITGVSLSGGGTHVPKLAWNLFGKWTVIN